MRSVALISLSLLILHGCDRIGGPPRQVYDNERYGFSIEYPDSLDIRVYTPEYAAIGKGSGEAFDAQVEVLYEQGDGESFRDFAVRRSRLSCAADGPELSLLCTTVRRSEPYTSKDGVEGEEIVLGHVTSRAVTGEIVARSERGPFIAFDLSGSATDVPPGSYAVLFVRAPVVLAPEEVDTALVRAVAASVRLTNGERGRGGERGR